MKITKILLTGAAAAAMAGASASGALAQEHDNLNVNHLVPDTAGVKTLNGSGDTALNDARRAVRGVSESPDALAHVANITGKIDQEAKTALAPDQ
ncbi:hypothetical protein ACFWY6_17985 [Streptomyces sp. NPDC059037]|uniref:hypothetical protein n=1 Tax=Streptomyces sp. NPDC059037 TaxID=3346710 RepID=UPI003675015F